jgi:hypothetical protein
VPAQTLSHGLCGIGLLSATETEHVDYRILPASGKVVIDGKFDDWDLSGALLICSDVENYLGNCHPLEAVDQGRAGPEVR